jgi:SAM-dependent methyltransferase
MVHWLERLVKMGALKPGQSMIEFGPQDMDFRPPFLSAVARRLHGDEEAKRILAGVDESKDFSPYAQEKFYSVFGITKYRSLDPFDGRSEYHYDLNSHVPIFSRFDVVTNFGTAEHVFNVANVFKVAFDLLPVGGLLLNVNPTNGDVDHGLFNLHPILFRTLAAHSGFEMVDYQFIDDIALRTELLRQSPDAAFDFDQLPIKLADMEDEASFKKLVYDRFLKSATDPSRASNWPGRQAPAVFDYSFVALRKMRAGRFRLPYQYTNSPLGRSYNLFRFALSWLGGSWMPRGGIGEKHRRL